jgi:hypothetical protein
MFYFNDNTRKKFEQKNNTLSSYTKLKDLYRWVILFFLGITAIGDCLSKDDPNIRVEGSGNAKVIGVVNGNINAQEFHQHYHGPSSPSSDTPLAFIEELHQQSENIRLNFESDPRIKNFKQATLVIGPTGFGKSTFLTWLGSSLPLQAIRKGLNIVLEGGRDQQLFVSHDKKTGTLYPTPVVFANPLERGQLALFCDCPGFGDVRGAHADIKNMVALSEVIRRTDAFNILLVISGKCLEESRNSSILDLLNQTAEMFFPSLEQYPMGALVFTKTQTGVDEGYIEKVREYEQEPENTLTLKARQWVRYCINHPNHHVLFMPAPSVVGPYSVSPRENWSKIQHLAQLQPPRFQPILSEDSKLYLSDLAASLNQQIAQKLVDQRQTLLDAFVNGLFFSLCEPSDASQFSGGTFNIGNFSNMHAGGNIHQAFNIYGSSSWAFRFKGSSRELLKYARIMKENLDLQERFTTEKAKALVFLEKLPGLTERSRQGLIEHVEHLDILRSLLGDVRNIRGRNIIIGYNYEQWLEDLQPMREAINSLWESFQRPKKTKQRILKETFTLSNQGAVREEEEFQLPIRHPWNGGTLTTVFDILTFKSKKYDHQDEELISIPIDKYTLYRDGLDSVTDEVIEERGNPIPYKQTKVDVTIIPGSFNVKKKQIGLNVVKLYERADQSSYERKLTVDEHRAEAVSSKISYQHHDQELYSQEIVPYHTIYEGETIDLEPQRERKVEYRLTTVDATVIPGSFNVQRKEVGLDVIKLYKRADQSSYRKEIRVDQNPVVALSSKIFYEHHDQEFYSQEMLPYHTVYEGKTLDLEPQKKEERLPYKVKNTSSDIDRSALRIRDGAVLNTTIEVIKTIEYERGDRSRYTAQIRSPVVVESRRRDTTERGSYIDYIVSYETVRTVLCSRYEKNADYCSGCADAKKRVGYGGNYTQTSCWDCGRVYHENQYKK